MEKKNYITPQGFKTLSDELNQLLRVERPEICQLVQWAAANGDRSENADYQYGKRRLREIDRRLRFLQSRLDAAVVVDPTKIKSDKVQFGATVQAEDENGKLKTWSIVGVDEIETAKNYISWQSPIGKALLGKIVGDEVVIQTPQGQTELTITQITYVALAKEVSA
ncbi:MAG: transcription elongation factor GreB [Bacteriovoracaceae bacterium]|nr:transcription elongation factor GreB [Bacteriovoracaceae bacterium]